MIKFLTNYWPHLTIGGMLLGLSILCLLLSAQRDAARAERDLAQGRVEVLTTQIESQNEGIRQLAEASKQNRDVYLAGLKAAEKKAIRLTVEADDILALPAPTNPDEACEAAAGVLRKVTQ